MLCVVGVETLEDAVEFINRNPNGNGVALFTQDGGAARYFQNNIDVGQVGINVPIPVPVAWFSFHGSRASKLGDLGPNGKQAVQFWTQTKTVTARWSAHTKSVNTTISMLRTVPEALRASQAPLRTGKPAPRGPAWGGRLGLRGLGLRRNKRGRVVPAYTDK